MTALVELTKAWTGRRLFSGTLAPEPRTTIQVSRWP
jgi:hypothetical protein